MTFGILALGFPVLQLLQPLGAHSLTFFPISSLSSLFPIFMHSLGDVWHPGSGVPCFGGFAAFAAFGGSQSHFLPYIFPIFMHSLSDVWHPYLNAFLR